MYVSGSLAGPVMSRKFRIGATTYEGQVICAISQAGANQYADVGAPASVNDYSEAVGIAMEAVTYAVSSPGQYCRCSYSPFQIFRGKASGGTAVDTAWTTAQLLTQDTASTTVLTDTAVADLDYEGGYLIALDGAPAGDVRTIVTQSDNTSTTVTIPFSASIPVGGTALRTYAPMIQGVELCATYYTQFNNLLATTEALTDAIGPAITFEIYLDDQALSQTPKITIKNPAAPVVEFEAVFADHAFNSLA